jgi:hypothetical protein
MGGDDINGVSFEENMPTRRGGEFVTQRPRGFTDALVKMHIVNTSKQAEIVLLVSVVLFVVTAAVVFIASQPPRPVPTTHQQAVLQAMQRGTFPPPEIK